MTGNHPHAPIDTEALKRINAVTKRALTETLAQYDQNLVHKALRWESVQEYVRQYGIHPVEEKRTVTRIPAGQE